MASLTQYFPLLVRNFDQVINDQQQALLSSLASNAPLFDGLNLTPGSPMLALMEANASMQLFMQWLVYKVLLSTRLATSTGNDLDSFGQDFLFARYPSSPATGQVIMTRATAGGTTFVPLNSVVKTQDGAQSFVVIPPTNITAEVYDPAKGYIMAPGVFAISVLVQAVTPGTIGNIAAGTITKLVSNIPIYNVTNPSSFVNGIDQSSDEAFRSAFALYIQSRDNATVMAIENAIKTTNASYTYSILENYIAVGAPQPGAVAIYFDDGTGFPSTLRQIELQNKVNAVRGACISPFVLVAHPVTITVECTLTYPSSNQKLADIGNISNAIEKYINSLVVGQSLLITRLYQIIYDASNVLMEASSLFIIAYDRSGHRLPVNGLGDILVNPGQVLRFLPNPPLLNGVAAIPPSAIVLN